MDDLPATKKKTVEALAVLAHLRANGRHHSIVVCPAAVVTTWVREVASKSTLQPHRVHGPGREAATRNWTRDGGVAVTTYETLGWFESHARAAGDLGRVVVDEAHYVKNPAAMPGEPHRRPWRFPDPQAVLGHWRGCVARRGVCWRWPSPRQEVKAARTSCLAHGGDHRRSWRVLAWHGRDGGVTSVGSLPG
ncbi:SNF2-related protein [Actinomadura sp. 21ATH]|uniref:SNF2-related protein n=1 Tax=Actinomadura sp. 21ATH TaxID=1735444 RepID=UPI0035BEE215